MPALRVLHIHPLALVGVAKYPSSALLPGMCILPWAPLGGSARAVTRVPRCIATGELKVAGDENGNGIATVSLYAWPDQLWGPSSLLFGTYRG
jgi:hypothetical protein